VYSGGDLQRPPEKNSQRRNGGQAMKNTRWCVLAEPLLASLLIPAMAMAQSPFDGTWKVDLKTAKFPEKPDVYLLQHGMYHCKTCVITTR
jgi:hypothetical protein